MSESYTIYIPDDVIIFGVIAMIVVLALLVRRRWKTGRSPRVVRPAERTPSASNRREQLRTNIRGLEQRLAAFEHYATDPSRRLAAEIDELGSADTPNGKPVS